MIFQDPVESVDKNVENQQTSEPDPVFSPPPVPASPIRPRSDTPRDLLQSPTYSVNHNVLHPPAAQSPFMPIPHPRIRTESLSSIKSIPANLQPRKKFRTEDQKIIDNKRESRERLSNKNVEKSQLRMFDMIYYNPSTNPMKARTTNKDKQEEIDVKPKEAPPQPEKQSSVPVPQLRLNADGELVLDESSLVVENEEHRRNRILLANTNVVYYDELSTNYGFYKRQKRTREWPHEETVKFYRCLNTVGTDFSLMLNLFPNRTRRDLKLKFKKEEKNNSQLIDKALLKFNTFDIEELQRELEKEDEERRKEAENGSTEVKELVKRKILKKQEAKARAQQQMKSKVEKILADGEEAIKVVDRGACESAKHDIKENFEEDQEKKKKPTKKRAAPKPNVGNPVKKRNVKQTENASDLPTIKLEQRDFKQETVDIQQNTSEADAGSDWSQSNVIDDVPQYPLIETTPLEAKIESQYRPVIEESNQVLSYEDNQPCSEMQYVENQVPYDINPIQSDQFDSSELSQQTAIENTTQFTFIEQLPQATDVEPGPSQSPHATPLTENTTDSPFDEESFLNSLNLEQLSIVVRQIDGKDFYDIHETDPETQLISDKPLNIPQQFKDLLISVLTQDD